MCLFFCFSEGKGIPGRRGAVELGIHGPGKLVVRRSANPYANIPLHAPLHLLHILFPRISLDLMNTRSTAISGYVICRYIRHSSMARYTVSSTRGLSRYTLLSDGAR
jgi:hypothetical protein